MVTLASIVEKETGKRRRAAAGRRRLHQPAEAPCGCSPIRRSSTACRRQGHARARHQASEIASRRPTTPTGSTACRPADRQSGPRGARGGGQSDEHQGALLRRRRHGRACLRRDARGAQPQRRALARAGTRESRRRKRRSCARRVPVIPAGAQRHAAECRPATRAARRVARIAGSGPRAGRGAAAHGWFRSHS